METAYEVKLAGGGRSAFLTQVREGRIVPLIQFGGQASQYWAEFATAYQESSLARECLEYACQALAVHVADPAVAATGLLTHGFDPLAWVRTPSLLPSSAYLSSSIVSQPLIFLTQVANLLRVVDGNREAEILLEHAAGYVGHSQGVMTAVCWAMGYPAKDFRDRVVRFATYFLWQGVRMQQAFPPRVVPADLVAAGTIEGEGVPTPMASLTGLTVAEADTVVAEFNATVADTEKIYRDLANAWNRVVVGGPTASLMQFRAQLKAREAAWQKDPILRSRKLVWEYIPTSAPFHTPYMAAGLEAFRADLKRLGFALQVRVLKAPVFTTHTGNNLQKVDDLMHELLQMQWLRPVHWPKVVAAMVRAVRPTHVLDLGPGDSAAKLTGINAEGRGVASIAVATPAGRNILFAPGPEQIPWGEDWGQYRPRAVAVASSDRLWIDNHFTRFAKVPPIFGGGMTPTSVETAIVVAAANAGYLVEWAGGGQVTEAIWRERLEELRRDLAPGRGVIFNALFLDPYLWNLHYPKIIALKNEGYPIIGMTISAGLPDLDKATEILRALNAAGIWCNAFKPGNDAMIAHFLQIADANPHYPIIMQVEGGKAGGHHSWEDIRGLITRNYARIRRRRHVILCVGGGIAMPDEAAAWLLGTWQTNPDCPPMPVDGVFLGTRLMACKEAKTSPQVKQLLVDLTGTAEWVRKLEVKGGVTSQESQLGADVHYADTAAARAGALLDRLAGKSREEILTHKDEIITLLNTTAKPYFGELPTMTYAAVLRRMVMLMAPGDIPDHLPHDGVWFDATFRQRAYEWAQRIEARFGNALPQRVTPDGAVRRQDPSPVMHDPQQFDKPDRSISRLLHSYPLAETTILHPEDVDYFLLVCRLPGKPVNFVPVIDEDVRRWYKADSLWQSHDPRYSADAVYTIPGPEAVRGITRVDELIAKILGGFEAAVIEHVETPRQTTLGAVGEAPLTPMAPELLVGGTAAARCQGTQTTWTLRCTDAALADGGLWRTWIASQGAGAVATFLRAAWIARTTTGRGTVFVPHRAAMPFSPSAGEEWTVVCRNGRVVEVRTPACRLFERAGRILLEIRHQPPGNGRVIPITFAYTYHPPCGTAPIQEVMEGRDERIAAFYAVVWGVNRGQGGKGKRVGTGLRVGQIFQSDTTVTRAAVEAYAQATDDVCFTPPLVAPPNMTIVHAWGAFAQALMACAEAGSLLDLLHLSNQFALHGRPIADGDRVTAKLRVERIDAQATGMIVAVAGTLHRGAECVADLASEFFIRGAKYGGQGTGDGGRNSQAASSFILTNEVNGHHVVPVAAADAVVPVPVPFNVASGTITAPASAAPYGAASRDTNPLHTDLHLAQLAGFDRPIMHGMWSNAALLRELTRTVAHGDPRRIRFARTIFTQPVFPGDPLTFAARQIGAADGARVLDATVTTPRGLALQARVHVREGRTAYLFTGQGSQQPGMGMEGYARSAAARAVWDQADAYCRHTFGCSIVHIVKENPRRLIVHGITLQHPQGVLHLTQFTQVALTVLAMAHVAELREAGCYDETAMYAGHSLGEYAALAATGILPLTEVVSVVYHRGLTMQHYVPRDAHGVSPYGMAVVRPNIVGYSEERLLQCVAAIARRHHGALEIVNLNIAGEQYSVTGETRLLHILRETLHAEEQKRGATKPSYIVLEGIDVPFHSAVLRDGVVVFRKTLAACIPAIIDVDQLIDRYIPNLTAVPFRVDRAYLQTVYDATDSPVVRRMLAAGRKEGTTKDARVLLIELLAYQFASPVQWVRTQTVLFDDPHYQVDRVIEVGPQAVLAGMAKRTLARGPLRLSPPTVWHIEQNRKDVFYIREEEPSTDSVSDAGHGGDRRQDPPSVEPGMGRSGQQDPSPLRLTDEPLAIRDALTNLLALKLKLRPDEIAPTTTIEKLAGGNSARRNEILADLGAEFNAGAIDDAQNKPLMELVGLFEKKVRYAAPGPYLRVATDQAIKGFLPLSRKAIMEYLASERCLPEGRVLAVMNMLPIAVRAGDSLGNGVLSPIGLGARLHHDTTVREWLDTLADWYGTLKGISVPRRSAGATTMAATVDAGALALLEAKYFGKEGALARAANALLAASGVDPYALVLDEDRELLESNRRLTLYTKELGPQFERVVTPLFDIAKALTFSSIWNWVRRDVTALYYNGVVSCQSSVHNRVDVPDNLVDQRPTIEDRRLVCHIVNAADQQALEVIRYFHRRAVRERRVMTAKVFAELERRVVASLRGPARFVPSGTVAHVARDIAVAKALASVLKEVATQGMALAGQRLLVTGAGPGSIGAEIVANVLAAGAQVVVTTTTSSRERTVWLRQLYATHAGRGAELHVVPANQGNRADMDAVVEWMMQQFGGIDACYPFGAVVEAGDLTTMDPGATTATWRVLVQGVEWLIAAAARAMAQYAAPGHRVAVVLPLSPNHGQFGGDGAYSEAKAALEVLLNRWRSEQAAWGKWIALIGPRIGWTRGTGLMRANDLIADAIEKETGCRTFSTAEMGFLLTALIHPKSVALAAKEPLHVDYTGGFGAIPDIAILARRLREQQTVSSVVSRQSSVKLGLLTTEDREPTMQPKTHLHYFSFPCMPSAEDLAKLPDLTRIDSTQVHVVVGYGEVSPYGSARTRWEMESTGTFSLEGCIELAWLMGLIRYESEEQHVGWVDMKSGEPVADHDVKARYEQEIVAHTGIRICEPALQGFDPRNFRVWGDVQLEEAFVVPVESREQGEAIVTKYNGQAELVTDDRQRTTDDASLCVRLKKGAIIKVARASRFPRYVAGQVPTGWDPTRYGIPKELVAQVDRNTLFNLIATAEAFLNAGCTPQELYDYFHPTRVGNSQGGGMGGMQALTHLYRAHREGQARKGDALQETLINVVAAWVTQSFVGSYGPTVHPVGACATAVVSLDTAVNLLATDKADFVVAGGYDDYSSEGVIGFNDMEATADIDTMAVRGIGPAAVSRPNDRRRNGFVEAQGGGTLLVTRLDHAVRMGLPIYAVVGCVATHSDGIHTSIPAPGLGLLGMATGGKQSPLATALARFGLTADDIAAVSKHDTSTKANDPNENHLHHLMQQAIGRAPGNPLLVHSQKAWLGHAKGGAGAWQANAAIQMLLTGTVPGNPNLDDLDPAMATYTTMCFSDRAMHLGPGNCRAVLFTSLGFGHVGAGALFLHPDYALRTLPSHELVEYAKRRTAREQWFRTRSWEILLGKTPAFERRTEKPFRTTKEEAAALLTHKEPAGNRGL